MLMIKRKRGERVVVKLPDGRALIVQLHRVHLPDDPGRAPAVTLGFTGPPDVGVWREELLAGRESTGAA